MTVFFVSFVVVVVILFVVVDLDDALSLDVSTERPDEVPSESSNQAAVPSSADLSDPDDGSEDATDESEPPAEEESPEEVTGKEMTLGGGRGDGVEGDFGVSSDSSGFLVEGRLPDGETEGMLGVDGLVRRR